MNKYILHLIHCSRLSFTLTFYFVGRSFFTQKILFTSAAVQVYGYQKFFITPLSGFSLHFSLILYSIISQIEVNEPGQEYKVEYRYTLTSVEEEGSSGENYFPDRFRVSNEASKYVSDASQFGKKPETKWIMYSAACSASCGGGEGLN